MARPGLALPRSRRGGTSLHSVLRFPGVFYPCPAVVVSLRGIKVIIRLLRLCPVPRLHGGAAPARAGRGRRSGVHVTRGEGVTLSGLCRGVFSV